MSRRGRKKHVEPTGLWLPGQAPTPKEVEGEKADVGIFVAGTHADVEEVRGIVKQLRNHQVEVTSTWHDEGALRWDGKVHKDPRKCTGGLVGSRTLQEILRCNWMLVLPSDDTKDEGMDVMLGFAIGIRRPIVLIGEPRNPFQCLPCCKKCANMEEFMMGLMTARIRGHRMAMQVEEQLKRKGRLPDQRGGGHGQRGQPAG